MLKSTHIARLRARSHNYTPSRYIISISLYVMAFGIFVCIQRTAGYDVPHCFVRGQVRVDAITVCNAVRLQLFQVFVFILAGVACCKAIHGTTGILYARRLIRRLHFHIL